MKKNFNSNKLFFIAEISSNHNNNFDSAKKLIREISKTGVDAVKFQTFKPEEMTLDINNKKFRINEKKSLWRGKKLYDLYKESSMNWIWQERLFRYARKCKLLPFSTPFGEDSLKFLRKQKCQIFKIASLESSHFPLLKSLAKTKKPIIISTGSATEKEISKSVKYLRNYGCKNLTILKCTSVYPASPSDLNLLGIPYLKKKFNCTVGFSDHSKNNQIAFAAVAAGAEIVEKHIALKEKKKGLDYEFSLKGHEIKKFKNDLIKSYKLLGKQYFYRNKDENKNKYYRRSIFAIKNILPGEKFTKDNIKVLRPNIGISSYYYEKIIGKKSPIKISCFDPLKLNIIKKLKLKVFKNEK